MTLQPTAIVHPDAELWLTTALRSALEDREETYASTALVSNTVPATRADYMVIVRRDGGPVTGVFDNPRFGINIWGATEQDAANLARLVAALLKTLPGDGTCVAMGEPSGPSPIPDESKQPRRYFTVEARLRGTPLEEF